MKQFKRKYISYLQYALIAISFFLFTYGNVKLIPNTVLFGVLLLGMSNLLYGCIHLKRRILFLLFHLVQFVFLGLRPFIAVLRTGEWMVWGTQAEYFAVRVLYLSFASLLIGAVLAEYIHERRKRRSQVARKSEPKGWLSAYESTQMKYIQWIAGAMFLGTWVVSMVLEAEKLYLMQGKSYVMYYVDFASRLPYAFVVLASMKRYFMCIYLATFPKKRISFCVLSLSILSEVPMLLIGMRNPIVLSCIFAFVYYFIRDAIDDREKWIGKWEKLMLAIGAPCSVAFLGAYAYIRTGMEVAISGIGTLIVNFFYDQGISFQVLAVGYSVIPDLPQRAWRNYTFGGVIDYITRGSIAQRFFGAEPLPGGNHIINATQSNSFAHNMSYLTIGPEAYLEGHGIGSSYLLETYADFGYVGVAIFTVILGALLIYSLYWMKCNILIRTIILVALTTLFLIPRAEAMGWIQFLIYMQFWISVGFVYIGAGILRQLNQYRIGRKH